jgi:hypothetical protein
LAAAHEHQGRGGVDHHAQAGDDHHRTGSGRFRRREAADGLPGDGADRDQQQDRVGQRGQDGALAQAVGAARARRALGQDDRAPGQDQAQDVRQVVAGVGQQGHGARVEADRHLGGDEDRVQGHADGEGPAHVLGRMVMAAGPMAMAVPMAVAMAMILMIMVVVVIIGMVMPVIVSVAVIVRHLRLISHPARQAAMRLSVALRRNHGFRAPCGRRETR